MNACSESVSPTVLRRRKSGSSESSRGRTLSNASSVPSWAKSQRRKRKGWVFSSLAAPTVARRAWATSASESARPTSSGRVSGPAAPAGRRLRSTLPAW